MDLRLLADVTHTRPTTSEASAIAAAFVPLLQTLSWIAFIVFVSFRFRMAIEALLAAIKVRIEKGSPIKFGPVELGELKAIKEDLQETKAIVQGLNQQQIELQQGYLIAAQDFDHVMNANELDALGTELKSLAAGLGSIDFLLPMVVPGIGEGELFAVACAIQSRPQSEFLDPLTQHITHLASSTDLNKVRLRVLFRAAMALENIVRVDNKRTPRTVSPDRRQQLETALSHLAAHPLCKVDYDRYRTKSIVARINRVLKLV